MLPLVCWFNNDPLKKEQILYCHRDVFLHVNPLSITNKTVLLYTYMHYFDNLMIRLLIMEDLYDLYNKSNYNTLELFIYNFFITYPQYIEGINLTKTNEVNKIMIEQELEHLKLLQKLYK